MDWLEADSSVGCLHSTVFEHGQSVPHRECPQQQPRMLSALVAEQATSHRRLGQVLILFGTEIESR